MSMTLTASQPTRVQVRSPSGEHRQTEVPVAVLTDAQRTSRALRGSGMAFAVGLLLIPIPLMHLIGPLTAWTVAAVLLVRRLGESARVLACQVPCPRCGGDAPIAEQRLQWPLLSACSTCRWEVRVEPENGEKTGPR